MRLVKQKNTTGNVKWYQIIVGGIQILNIPFSFFALKCGLCVESTAIISLTLCVIALFLRLQISSNIIGLKLSDFSKSVIVPVCKVTILSSILPFILSIYLKDNLLSVILVTILSILSISVSILLVGCTNEERHFITSIFKKIIRK